jgi:hypothetical protein
MMKDVDNKIKYEFDEDSGIFYKSYFGVISVNDILASWEYAFENKLIPPGVNGFILDHRNSILKLNTFDYLQIVDFYKNNLNIFRNFKIGTITEDPHGVVVTMLIGTIEEGYATKPFATKNCAVNWVLS